LLVKYGDLDPRFRNDPSAIQSLVEGQHLDQREFLLRYDTPVEGQRNKIHMYRQDVLDGSIPCESDLERQITLRTIDELWADYLARLEDFRAGIPWQAYAAVPGFFVGTDRRDPHFTFLRQIDEWFPELEAEIPREVARRLAQAEDGGGVDLGDRGAVWTYLTTDQPFGSWTERVMKGIRNKLMGR
jgi:preprotein translocase subunit SecA